MNPLVKYGMSPKADDEITTGFYVLTSVSTELTL